MRHLGTPDAESTVFQMRNHIFGSAGLLVLLGFAAGCGSNRAILGEAEKGSPLTPLSVSPEAFVDSAQGAYVLIDLDRNRLRFMEGDEVLWEAPVGTGTGLRLRSDDGDDWDFSTPRGVFQVKFKEEMPVWYLPDWYFVEKNLPVPAENSPARRQEGQLGV